MKNFYEYLTENTNTVKSKRKVKDWFISEYPDSYKQYIEIMNPEITFQELYDRMRKGEDFNKLIAVDDGHTEIDDAAIRHYFFAEMAKIFHVNYETIFDIWANQ